MSMKVKHAGPHPGSAREMSSGRASRPDAASNGPPAGRARSAATESRESAGLSLPTAAEIAAATGLTRGAARDRLVRYRHGRLSYERLMEPKRGYTTGDPEWGDLGLGPRKQIDSIRGTTPLERRVFGRCPPAHDDAEAAERRKANYGAAVELIAEIMRRVPGLGERGAKRRAYSFRSGQLPEQSLFLPAGIGKRGRRDEEVSPVLDEIVARVGICRAAAGRRLARFRAGKITEADLYRPAEDWRRRG